MEIKRVTGWPRADGSSMIELLIMLTLLGLLAAQVYPSFRAHVVRVRRGEAQAALQQLMQQQERYYTQNNRYLAFSSSSTDPEEKMFRWWTGNSAPVSAYEIEGKACEGETIASCVRLVATPGTDQVDRHFKDEDCAQLTLTSAGQRLASGSAPRCWP